MTDHVVEDIVDSDSMSGKITCLLIMCVIVLFVRISRYT